MSGECIRQGCRKSPYHTIPAWVENVEDRVVRKSPYHTIPSWVENVEDRAVSKSPYHTIPTWVENVEDRAVRKSPYHTVPSSCTYSVSNGHGWVQIHFLIKYITYRIKPEELFNLSCEKGLGRTTLKRTDQFWLSDFTTLKSHNDTIQQFERYSCHRLEVVWVFHGLYYDYHTMQHVYREWSQQWENPE